jgi:hypothetical protein
MYAYKGDDLHDTAFGEIRYFRLAVLLHARHSKNARSFTRAIPHEIINTNKNRFETLNTP